MPYKNRKKEYAKRKRERVLDKLAAFQEFQAALSPKMQRMILDGSSAEEIIAETAAYAAARIATIAVTDNDSGKAYAAAKDILDRAHGKAVERRELKHKFAEMNEDEIDAMIVSQMKEVVIEGAIEASEEDEDDGSTETT